MPKRITLDEAHSRLISKFPDLPLTLVEFSGVNKPCKVSFDGVVVEFPQYQVVAYEKSSLLLKAAIERKINTSDFSSAGNSLATSKKSLEQRLLSLFPKLNIEVVAYSSSMRPFSLSINSGAPVEFNSLRTVLSHADRASDPVAASASLLKAYNKRLAKQAANYTE